MVTAPLAQHLIAHDGLRPTLRLLAGVFTLVIVALASAFQLPPRSWAASGPAAAPGGAGAQRPPLAGAGGGTRLADLLHCRAFYGLWICYVLAALVGLSAIGISGPVGEEIIRITPNVAARSVAVFALFNGLSRPLFGWLTDHCRPQRVAMASFGLILLACLLMIRAQPGQEGIYLVAFSLLWFCLGGWVALAPTATLRLFDRHDYARNYGLVSTAYGLGALLGTVLAGRMRDALGSYVYGFYPMALLALLGLGVASWLLKPEAPAAEH